MATNDGVILEISADVKEAVAELESIRKQMQDTASMAGELRNAFSGMQSSLSGNNNAIGGLTEALKSLERTVNTLISAFRNAGSEARNSFEQMRINAQKAAKDVSQAQTSFARLALPAKATWGNGFTVRDGLNLNDLISEDMLKSSKTAWDKFTTQARERAAKAAADAGKAFSGRFASEMELVSNVTPFFRAWGNLDKSIALAVGGAFAAIGMEFRNALNVGGGFETQMTNVKVISGATGEELEALTAKAREMGATLPITAQQAAAAMEVLAQRGTKAKDILENVTNVSNLVISQGMDMASAASLIGSTMTNFGIAVQDAARITDVFNNAANQSALSANTLQTSMNYVAPAAAAAGLSLEQTVAAMEVLANAGLDASMVGTGMAMVIQKLAGANYVLGVRTKDVEGNMRPLEEIFAELKERGMTLAEATEIFGARASKAALNLMKYSDTLGENEANLRKTGSTSDAVSEKMKTWPNVWNSFMSAAESVHITIFDQIKEQSKEAVSGLAGLTRNLSAWINETKIAQKATDAFLAGLGFDVKIGDDISKMMPKINVEAIVQQVKKLGSALKDVAGMAVNAFNVVKGPLSWLIKNLDTFVRFAFSDWIVSKAGGIVSSISSIGGALGGLVKYIGGRTSRSAFSAFDSLKGLSYLKPLNQGLQETTSLIGKMKGAVMVAGDGLMGFLNGILNFLGPGGLIATGIAGVIAGANALSNKMKEEREKIRKMNEEELDASVADKRLREEINAPKRELFGEKSEYYIKAHVDVQTEYDQNTDERRIELIKKYYVKALENVNNTVGKSLNSELAVPLIDSFEKLKSLSKDSTFVNLFKIIETGDIEAYNQLPDMYRAVADDLLKMSSESHEFVDRLTPKLREAKRLAEEGAKAQKEQETRESKWAKEEKAGGKKAVQSEFEYRINADINIKQALEDVEKNVQKTRDLLGDQKLELNIKANAEQLTEKIKESVKKIAQNMNIPENVALEAYRKQLDGMIKSGKDTTGVLKKVNEALKSPKEDIEKYIGKAQDAIKYFGAAPSAFLPALNAMTAKMDMFDGFDKMKDEAKLLLDTIKEFESSAWDKFTSGAQDSMNYLGKMPSVYLSSLGKVVSGMSKFDPMTKKLNEGWKKGYDTLKNMAKVTFDNLKSEFEKLKKAAEGGFIDKKALEKERQRLEKELALKFTVEYEADRDKYREMLEPEHGANWENIYRGMKLGEISEGLTEVESAWIDKLREEAKNFGWTNTDVINRYIADNFKRMAGQYTDSMEQKQKEAISGQDKDVAAQDKAVKSDLDALQRIVGDVSTVTNEFKTAAAKVGDNVSTVTNEFKTAAATQAQATLDFSGNVTAVQTSVTTIVTRLGQMEKTIQANTKALDDARLALTNGGKVDTAKTTATKAAPETAKEPAEIPSSLETVLSELKTAIENMPKAETTGAEAKTEQPASAPVGQEATNHATAILAQLETIAANTQSLGSASTAITELASRNTNTGETTQSGDMTKAVDSLSNVERSISEHTQALRAATTELSKISVSNSGGDVTINLQDFTVRQESDIQRIKQIVLDSLRSAGLMRPGLGMGTV